MKNLKISGRKPYKTYKAFKNAPDKPLVCLICLVWLKYPEANACGQSSQH